MDKTDYEINTDILVIGGGLAGCMAAIKAAQKGHRRVTIVDKCRVGSSGSSVFAAGLINICTGEDDMDAWFKEIVTSGEYLNDQEWVKIQLSRIYPLIKEIEEWGLEKGTPIIKKDAAGKMHRVKGRGNSTTMTNLVYSKDMMDLLRKKLREYKVDLVERTMITDLLVSGGKVVGAIGVDYRNNKTVSIQSKCVIMAAAGCGFKSWYLGHRNLTGEGQAAAYEIGAAFRGMEHPEANSCPKAADIVGMGIIVSQGGRFVNRHGEEFMFKYDKFGNRASAPKLVIGFALEAKKGNGPIYLDLSRIKDRELLREMAPRAIDSLESVGISPFDQKIEVIPGFHGSLAQGGGMEIDTRCRTNIPGLFAVGDSSCSPTQGTISVQGMNLAYCIVSGEQAASAALEYINSGQAPEQPNPSELAEQQNKFLHKIFSMLKLQGYSPDEVIYKIQEAVIPSKYRFVTNQNNLNESLSIIREIRNNVVPQVAARNVRELVKALEARSMITIAEMITMSALARKESRGFLYRDDYKNTDNINWVKWIRLQKNNGEMSVNAVDVPLPYITPERNVFPRMEVE